ncbi:hypothetical protein RJ640_021871 [Escallonia rubra]|uniref:Protein kinase domain-containing protein n=1 Tax=Escallonia rubra TaxID=112253 RepID=A0AA88RCI6_9ASTE|nr:hypothetical protein RJ640_021871 [Escallonia rubra]
MFTLNLHLYSFLLLLLSTATAATQPPYTPTDHFLLNCGSTTNSTSHDGRNWDGDTHSKFSPSNTTTTTTTSTNPSGEGVPFTTARIFRSPFTYTFPVSPGPKFLRLYFYPATPNFSTSFFSVTAGQHSLLTNFSAFLAAIPPLSSHFVKEYFLNVKNTQKLDVTIWPSPNSFAFINGIEIVSIPEGFYVRNYNVYRIPLVGQHNFFEIDNNTSFETLYRLNVGGNYVPATEDTGMFREWNQDDAYIYGAAFGFVPHRNVPIKYTSATPNYSAPETVYTTTRTMGNLSLHYNLTWIFTVDAGFYYLVRMYFCEIQLEVTQENQRMFRIFINNQTAEEEADVIAWSGGTGIPVFKDYVVHVVDTDVLRSKQDLWLAMHPNLETGSQYGDAILNGLEIFKLNKSDGSLAGRNPDSPSITPPPYRYSPEKGKSKAFLVIVAVTGGVIGGIAVFSILGILVFRQRRRGKNLSTCDAKSSWGPISHESRSTNKNASSLPSDLCRRFSLAEVKSATGDFNDNFIIGVGGFGNVYRGCIDDGTVTVAIKRLNPTSRQGAREFDTEIQMLSKLRHLHLVSLIGYCDDNGEMVLVYDYMAHGTLRDHLYKTNNPPLSWKQRLRICIGAAKGLQYLHTGAKHTIIHRDVKSTNILLDEKWVAKVSDFGLSKMGPQDVAHAHVSTVVKGSFGYVDPEYYRLQQLTEKSDVYSFGVVLFEVLCARPAIMPNQQVKESVNLAEWVRQCYRKGVVDQIVDPHVRGEIVLECFSKFTEVAYNCLQDQGIERPTMNDVVWSLEFALQLQEFADVQTGHVAVTSGFPANIGLEGGGATTTDDDDNVFSGSTKRLIWSESSGKSTSSSDGFKTGPVFSELSNPTGR